MTKEDQFRLHPAGEKHPLAWFANQAAEVMENIIGHKKVMRLLKQGKQAELTKLVKREVAWLAFQEDHKNNKG